MKTKKPLTNVFKDFSTKKGGYSLYEMTVGSYLNQMGIYNPGERNVNWDTSVVHADFQRAVLPIAKNPIKRRMFRDLLRGATLPPIVLYQAEGQQSLIVDGLQRTHVEMQALKALITIERGEQDQLENFAKEEIAAIKELNQSLLSVNDFLDRPIILQEWSELETDELVRLFMLLNVGQQKVSPRHLIEVMGQQMRGMFEDWGILLLTEVEKSTQTVKRRGNKHTDDNSNKIVPFNYEYLLNGLYAYVSCDPHIKTKSSLENNNDANNSSLAERVAEIGSELCASDYTWVCQDLNKVIQDRYKGDPKWRVAIQSSDNFFIPLMSALGEARIDEKTRSLVEDKKQKLIELIQSTDDSDPLGLSNPDSKGLASIQKSISSNIGRRQRFIVHNAWLSYFKNGFEDPKYPIDWRNASLR